MIEVRGLTKRFSGLTAVSDVNFSVSPGEVLGCLGPNGSGKSTTVKMLLGLVEPSSGSVLLNGRSIQEDLLEFRRHVGYVPEEPHLYPFLNGREYLALVGRLRGMRPALVDDKATGLLQLFGLGEYGEHAIASYSKGMKQKVLISAALLHDPDVLVFDEPLSGLDVTASVIFRHLIHHLARRGKVIIYSSHVLEVVEKVCSRVVVLHRGRMVAYDTVDHLRQLMSKESLEQVFRELVFREDPEEVARNIADLVTTGA